MFRIILPAALLCLSLSAASAQSCTSQPTPPPPSHTVSAADLRIPSKAREHFVKARTASLNNQPERFEREAAAALAVYPGFAEIYLLRATRALRTGQYDAAVTAITTARQLQTQLPWSGTILASALTQLRRFDEAVAELDRLPDDEARSWQARFERARAETGRHNTPAALQWSELAVTAAPAGCNDVLIVRANALQLAGRWQDAIAQLQTYLARDPQGTYHTQVQAALENTRHIAADTATTSLVASR